MSCSCLLDGRRGRAPDEYLKRRHPGLHRFDALHLHEGSFRQDSLSLQSGIYPHCIARVPAGIALPLFGSVVYQSHRKTIESSGLASRPAQLHPCLNPYRQVKERISQLHTGINEIRELKSQIKDLHTRFGEDQRVKPALQAADEMEKKMSEVEQRLIQVNTKSS
jgi:hypothetical protein